MFFKKRRRSLTAVVFYACNLAGAELRVVCPELSVACQEYRVEGSLSRVQCCG